MFHQARRLISEGGATELVRGIRDYVYYSPLKPLFSLIYSSRSLTVDDIQVSFAISNTESIRRSLGHGETDVISDLLGEVSTDSVVWDVGANQGTYSLFAGKRGAEVYGFEPGISAANIFKRNLKLNRISSVTVNQFALGSEDKVGVLKYGHRSGVRQVDDGGIGDPIEIRRGDSVSVPSPDVLKVDVEGAEVNVLRGLESKLKSCRVCYVEIHDDNHSAVTNLLNEYGFEVANQYSNILKFTRVDGGNQ